MLLRLTIACTEHLVTGASNWQWNDMCGLHSKRQPGYPGTQVFALLLVLSRLVSLNNNRQLLGEFIVFLKRDIGDSGNDLSKSIYDSGKLGFVVFGRKYACYTWDNHQDVT